MSYRHPAVLLAVSGRRQEVVVAIDDSGVALYFPQTNPNEAPKLLERFSYTHIVKWVPANLRQRNKGPRTCLDLQFQTTKGLKDLRMQFRSAEEVEQCVLELHDSATRLLQRTGSRPSSPTTPNEYAHTPMSATPSGSYMGSFSHFHPQDRSTSPHTRGRNAHTSPQRKGRSVSPSMLTRGPPFNASAPSAHFNDSIPRLPPAFAALEPGSEAQTPASRSRRLELPRIITRQADAGPDYQSQIKFLEDMVKRLSEELGAAQRRTGGDAAAVASAGGGAGPPAYLASSPAPPWLVEQRYMSPLLQAYDARISQLESSLQGRQDELGALAKQVDEVVEENDSLQTQLREALELITRQAAAQQQHPGATLGGEVTADAGERIKLLLHENNLLTVQNGDLSKELERLRSAEDEAVRRSGQLNAEIAGLADKLSAKEAQLDSLKRKLHVAQEQVERLQGPPTSAARGERADGEQERRVLDVELRLLKDKHERLLADHDALKRSRAADESSVAALQLDADNAREEAAALRKEMLVLRKQAGELRASLQSSTARLREYQQKDVEVYTRIREAMEVAEQNKLAHEAAASRERELNSEVATLRDRLAQRALEGAGGAEGGDGDRAWEVRRLRRELDHANRALKEVEDEVVDLKSSLARVEREKRSLKEEVEARETSARAGPSSDALGALQRALDAQQERDALSQQLGALQRSVQRSRNEDEVQRHALEAQLEDARNQIAQLQVSASMAKSDAAGFLRQLEQTKRLLGTVKASKQRTEEEMRAALASVRSERDAEVKILASKLEDAINSYNRSVTEAERMLASKENILRKYKSEAQSMAHKFESEREKSNAIMVGYRELQQHVNSATAENVALEGELAAVIRSADDAVYAHSRATGGDGAVSRAKYEELTRRLHEAEVEKEKVLMERDRVTRAPDLTAMRPASALAIG